MHGTEFEPTLHVKATMNTAAEHPKRIAVIGGGISGVATAHRLTELAPQCEVTLFEEADRIGGLLNTVRQDGFLLETGADNFITNIPWGIELCRRIEFEDQLVQTRAEHRTAFVVRRGRLLKIPQGFIVMSPTRMWPIISTPILSPLGKLRMACEYFVRQRQDESDESLARFVTRRFGKETYERLVQPLLGGIYTGDPEQLSTLATMPRFREMEHQHGSLSRAMLRHAKKQRKSESSGGSRYSLFVAPRDGISSLLQAIANRLPPGTIETHSPVQRIAQQETKGWTVSVGGNKPRTVAFDAVILATQAKAAAKLLADVSPQIADPLDAIHHSGCAIVSLAFRRSQIAHPMDGFGFVVPIIENRKILSGSFSSIKYPGRAPDDQVLIRVFIGGACQPELLELSDDALREIAVSELAELMGITGEPTLTRIARLPETMPQYYVGHQQRIATIESCVGDIKGLFLTGNAFHGVGIPLCVHSGEKAAEQASNYLTSNR